VRFHEGLPVTPDRRHSWPGSRSDDAGESAQEHRCMAQPLEQKLEHRWKMCSSAHDRLGSCSDRARTFWTFWSDRDKRLDISGVLRFRTLRKAHGSVFPPENRPIVFCAMAATSFARSRWEGRSKSATRAGHALRDGVAAYFARLLRLKRVLIPATS
jgi:hypothetical protein